MTTPNDYLEYQAYAAQQQTVQRRDEHLDQKAESRSAQRRRANLETNEANVRELLAERDRLAAENARLREALEFARKKLALMAIEGEVTRRIIRAALKEDGWRER